MYYPTKAGGEEQAMALLTDDSEDNRSQSHRAWLILKVLVCTFAFVMLALSLGSCVVYNQQYGEHKVLSTQVEEHSVDQCGGLNRLATVKPGAVVEPRNVEMFSSQRHVYVQNSAVLKGKLGRKSHVSSRAKMSSFLGIVEDLLHEDLLKLHHKTLCLDSQADKEVDALRARGFKDALGINLLPAPLNPKHQHENTQIKKFADQKFDFFFTSMFDYISNPALFVAEIEQTLKVGGLAAMHVSLNKWRNKYITGGRGQGIKPVTLLFQHSEIVYVSSVAAPGLDTLIVFKKILQEAKAIQVDRKEMKKRKQLHDNPSMPRIGHKTGQAFFEPEKQEYVGEQQLRSRRYAPKGHGTAGSLTHTSMHGTFLPSMTHFRDKIVMKKSMPMSAPGASDLNTFFVQGLRNIAQLSRAIVQDSFPASRKRSKVVLRQAGAQESMAVDT